MAVDGYRVEDRAEDGPPWYLVYEKRRWIALLIAWAFGALVWHVSTLGQSAGAVGTLLLVYILAEIMWDYRRERWLWISLLVIGGVHLAAIAFIPYQLPSGPALPYVFPIFMIDGFLMWGALRWLATKLSPAGVQSLEKAESAPDEK